MHPQVRDAKIKRLEGLRTGGASMGRYTSLSEALLADHPSHIPLLLEALSFARTVKPPKEVGSGKAEAAAWQSTLVDAAVGRFRTANGGPISLDALAQYFGQSHETGADASPAEKKLAKEMGAQRSALQVAP